MVPRGVREMRDDSIHCSELMLCTVYSVHLVGHSTNSFSKVRSPSASKKSVMMFLTNRKDANVAHSGKHEYCAKLFLD